MSGSGNKFSALVPAAGSGERMLSQIRKPFLRLDSVPILIHALSRLRATPGCGDITLAVHPADLDDVLAQYGGMLQNGLGVSRVIAGAVTRQQTVAKMLEYISLRSYRQLVLIHDGARPLVRPDIVEAAVDAAKSATGGAIVAVPAQATVKRVNSRGEFISTPERKDLWLAQTPQVFWADPLINAYKEAATCGWSVTDDAEILERAGFGVMIVKGSCDNIKVTNPEDLKIAGVLLEYQKKQGVSIPLTELC